MAHKEQNRASYQAHMHTHTHEAIVQQDSWSRHVVQQNMGQCLPLIPITRLASVIPSAITALKRDKSQHPSGSRGPPLVTTAVYATLYRYIHKAKMLEQIRASIWQASQLIRTAGRQTHRPAMWTFGCHATQIGSQAQHFKRHVAPPGARPAI